MGNLTNSGNLIDTINSKQSLIIQSANQPTNPNTGDYWYDTTNKLLKYYNGSSRDPVGANVRVLTQSEYDALTPAEKSNGTLYLITGDSEELTIKWANITDKPNFATVATSGSYNDLNNKPTIPSALGDLTGNSDNITEGTTNKFVTSAEKSKISTAVQPGDLATVATSGSYNDLSDKPTIPSSLGDLSGTSDNITEGSTNKFVTTTEKSKISTAVQPGDLATVATSGDYNDLINLPSIPVDADDVNALPDTTKYGASLSMTMNTSTYVVTAQLKDQDGNNLGTAQTIDLPLESVVVSGSYDSATKKVILKLKDGSTVDFSVADLISGLQSEITSTNKLDADLVDDTNSAHKFVSATEKSTWNGKQAALTTAQLNAANSGITSAKVSTYDGYATTIAGKQAALNSDQLAAANSGITATKVGTYDGYATSKQDKLATQTAYSQKGSATKVPQITTNTLGQVTGITETSIAFPVTSVNGSTGAVTVQATLVSGTNIKTINNKSLLGSGNISIAAGGDMNYADYNRSATTGATVTLSFNTEHTPSANFTVNAPATIKDGQTYILRVANGATAYTMTLGTNITNPYSTSTTLTANGIDQFVFVAKGGSLELQPEIQGGGGSGGGTRGSITGTLSDQTDLNTALNVKANTADVLTKNNTTTFTPTGDYQPATKKYVDDNAGGEQNLFIITEDMVTVSTDATKGVAPYNTSYGYTNIDINANAGIEWKEGAIYTFVVNTEMVVNSAHRNVRVRIGSGAYIPVMVTTAAASGNAYFIKTAIRQFQYTTKYESGGALHVFTDSNTTYKAMTAAEATAGTATTALLITPAILKGAITTHAPVKSVNGATGAVTVQPTISDLSTIRTNATNGATVVSGDSGQNYVIKVSTTAPASGTAGNIITIVTD